MSLITGHIAEIISAAIGILVGGAVTARFPKLFAWFSKQDASIVKKV